ncbi:uncharacterized protein LOC129589975 isoform X2 [Paramacrobiotus metropolitanus]|uniref:uncharacterized protein LOC129589975 isoform X2 n=1 Tax=Paramacrobiotus metropolitanus TaxID=2943436 RepID=UPI002445E012|nr:uncharacterized protein LOC129589975 isoform X2 [Paramacrobiotus metropolitanus]
MLIYCTLHTDDFNWSAVLPPVPFPIFSAEPMAHDQCRLQYTDNCWSRENTLSWCISSPVLNINCNSSATSHEIQQMAENFAQPPLRPVLVDLDDGEQVTSENMAAVRDQVVLLSLSNCVSARTTGKLSSLRFPNLLEFSLGSCYNLKIRRSDFWQSMKLRFIEFFNGTIQSLEKDTFADLPALRVLSLEAGLASISTFSAEIRTYLKELHCSTAFEWFRRWWDNKHLLKSANYSEVYQMYPSAWGNHALNKSEMYLPIDCAAKPFPTGTSSIDFSQERFSVNDDLYHEKWRPGDTADADDRYPEFSIKPLSAEECVIQKLSQCYPSTCEDEQYRKNYITYQISFKTDTDCRTNLSRSDRIQRVVNALIRLPIRPVTLEVDGRVPVLFAEMAPLRKRIIQYHLLEDAERGTAKLRDLYLTNLIEFMATNCSDLDIRKIDFERSKKLRQIMFHNTTIQTLEEGSFTDLPSLTFLSLEFALKTLRTFEEHLAEGDWWLRPVAFAQRMRDFLFHLHCSCEFAWFRRWWNSNNTVRFSPAVGHGKTAILTAVPHSQYTFYPADQIPIDCAQPIPLGSEYVNVNQTEFSAHEPVC